MTLINLTTLFGINSAYTPAQKSVNFKAAGNISAFPSEGLEPYKDKFSTNPFSTNFKSKAEIEHLAKSSPRIMALLKEYNLPLRVNMDVLEEMI